MNNPDTKQLALELLAPDLTTHARQAHAVVMPVGLFELAPKQSDEARLKVRRHHTLDFGGVKWQLWSPLLGADDLRVLTTVIAGFGRWAHGLGAGVASYMTTANATGDRAKSLREGLQLRGGYANSPLPVWPAVPLAMLNKEMGLGTETLAKRRTHACLRRLAQTALERCDPTTRQWDDTSSLLMLRSIPGQPGYYDIILHPYLWDTIWQAQYVHIDQREVRALGIGPGLLLQHHLSARIRPGATREWGLTRLMLLLYRAEDLRILMDQAKAPTTDNESAKGGLRRRDKARKALDERRAGLDRALTDLGKLDGWTVERIGAKVRITRARPLYVTP